MPFSAIKNHLTPRQPLGIIGLVWLAVLASLILVSVATGSAQIAIDDVFGALLRAAGLSDPADSGPLDRIIVDLRLPRTVTAVMVGAGLGVVGCLLQTATRNDLADPFLFGLSSGAAAGAVFVITVTGDRLGIWTLPLAAFVGGMISALVVLGLVRRLGNQGPEKLVLAGLAVSFLFAAITNYLIFSGDQRAAHSVLFWTLGGLGTARWENVPIVLLGVSVVVIFAILKRRDLDALLAGDLTASSLGVDPNRLRKEVFLVSAFGTAIFVSVTGVIGFVGLMVPHLARALCGTLHSKVTILSAMFGAALLTGSDIVARILLIPQEIPIGIVTSSIGALFVFALLLKRT